VAGFLKLFELLLGIRRPFAAESMKLIPQLSILQRSSGKHEATPAVERREFRRGQFVKARESRRESKGAIARRGRCAQSSYHGQGSGLGAQRVNSWVSDVGALGQQGRLLPRRAIIIVEPESYYADSPELESEAESESDDKDIPPLGTGVR
jgi:hypothetical protein